MRAPPVGLGLSCGYSLTSYLGTSRACVSSSGSAHTHWCSPRSNEHPASAFHLREPPSAGRSVHPVFTRLQPVFLVRRPSSHFRSTFAHSLSPWPAAPPPPWSSAPRNPCHSHLVLRNAALPALGCPFCLHEHPLPPATGPLPTRLKHAQESRFNRNSAETEPSLTWTPPSGLPPRLPPPSSLPGGFSRAPAPSLHLPPCLLPLTELSTAPTASATSCAYPRPVLLDLEISSLA